MKITVKTSALFAALECSAKKDLRYYLQGINIQITKDAVGMVYGTDGHILFAGQLPYEGDYCPPTLNLIIPTDAVKRLDKKLEFTELEYDGQNYLLGGARFVPVDGRYSDIRSYTEADEIRPLRMPEVSIRPAMLWQSRV